MNLTNTLKRIDVFLGASEQAAREADHIEQAVAALKGICDDLEQEALAEPVLADTAGLLSKHIKDALNAFLRKLDIARMTREVQAEAFKQIAAHYGEKCELFKTIRTESAEIHHRITAYEALYETLQTKYNELLDK